MTNLIINLLYCGSFILHTKYGQSSRPHNLKNGVAQSSVLAPTLYNVYTYDFPDTLFTKYVYADDVALTFSAPTFSQSEKNLTEDMATVQKYLSKWHLKLSTTKIVCSVFTSEIIMQVINSK